MKNFLSQTLPNWLMAIGALWGVFEIIRGYFKLKRQQKENEQKMIYFNEELNEIKKQTTQFEYQTIIMSENNQIIEAGIDNLVKIFGRTAEAEEMRVNIEKQRRLIEIRPFFMTSSEGSNPREFHFTLKNNGGTAQDFRIIDISARTFKINPIDLKFPIERGNIIKIIGIPNSGQNANMVTGQILLGFTDVDNNPYQQNVIKNYNGYQIGPPSKIEK